MPDLRKILKISEGKFAFQNWLGLYLGGKFVSQNRLG